MGQIVKRKKNGRSSKADLAGRDCRSPEKAEPDVRRSLRRRNVKYNIDYDDYLDDDDEDEEEDQRRIQKQKKLKLVGKLNQTSTDGNDSGPSHPRSGSRGDHAHMSEDEESERKNTVKKRRDSRNDEEDEDEEDDGINTNDKAVDDDADDVGDDDDDDREDNDAIVEQQQEKVRKLACTDLHSVPGTPPNLPSGIPLPVKKTLELILDKLQKKDTYGVYAEPVDPEELPDYHEVIEYPMDFATLRLKLANGSYSTLEQFEDDVFLICSNAMQYNAADTIYHKQARSIQDLARKKFERIRLDFERSDKEAKSDQKSRSTPLSKKPLKKPVYHISQEPVGSDFSSGETLATPGDLLHGPNIIQFGSCERPVNNDGLLEGNTLLTDANAEKPEDVLLGKNLLNKLGRKTVVHEDERRATYNLSNQPVARSESVFTMLEGEIKQLVAVGLHAEYSYARSLARFAATLGPVAWKITSQRIRQALPAGVKFGRGWVGEYESPPTPALVYQRSSQLHSSMISGPQYTVEPKNSEKICQIQAPSQQPACTVELKNGEQLDQTHVPAQRHTVKALPIEGQRSSNGPGCGITAVAKPSFFDSASTRSDGPVNNFYPRNFTKPELAVSKQVELNSMPSANHVNTNSVAKFSSNMANPASISRELLSRSTTVLQSAPFKLPDKSDATSNQRGTTVLQSAPFKLPDKSDATSNQRGRLPTTYSPNGQEQGLSDPVQMMKILSEKSKKQHDSSNHSQVDTGTPQPLPSRRRDESNNAAAAARSWMSLGAGGLKQRSDGSSSPRNQIFADSLYNPSRDFHLHNSKIRGDICPGGMPLQSDKNSFSFQAFVPQPIRVGSEAQFHNRPVMFPHSAGNELSRFNMQSPWRGLGSPQSQPKQKQETLPPDLNISYQSAGSPVRQSSGVVVEPQQPDLALQL